MGLFKRKKKIDSMQLLTVIKSVVRMAEVLSPGDGPSKRAWVIDFVNDQINLPILGEKGEAILIGALVDLVVALFNGGSDSWDG